MSREDEREVELTIRAELAAQMIVDIKTRNNPRDRPFKPSLKIHSAIRKIAPKGKRRDTFHRLFVSSRLSLRWSLHTTEKAPMCHWIAALEKVVEKPELADAPLETLITSYLTVSSQP